MISRGRNHILGDEAVGKLFSYFNSAGWTCERLTQDYGEDLLVRIFENGKATQKYFFVQSKSTDNISRYETKNNNLRYPFKMSNIAQWAAHVQPILVTLYDSVEDRFYWQCIQKYRSHLTTKANLKKSSVLFNKNKFLSDNSFKEINNIVDEGLQWLDYRHNNSCFIADQLKKFYGMEISYSSSGTLLLPEGVFQPSANGGKHLVLFGELARTMEKIVQMGGGETYEKAMENAIDFISQIVNTFVTGGAMQVRSSSGEVIETFNSFDELAEHIASTGR